MLKRELSSSKTISITPPTNTTTANTSESKNISSNDTQPKPQQIDSATLKFKTLIEKLYDREYELGEIFKKNITFKSFENSELTWISKAEGKDREFLIKRWSIIRMFVQEIFGLDTNIKNIAKKEEDKKKSLTKNIDNSECNLPDNATTSSTVESVELPSSCMNPDTGDSEASKEKDPSKLLEEPMIKEAIELFGAKKVRIRPKS